MAIFDAYDNAEFKNKISVMATFLTSHIFSTKVLIYNVL